MHVLVTGATGYIGGRLVTRLLDAGHTVRVLVRDASRINGRPWAQRVEVVEGDVLQPATLPAAVSGVETAYYLVHSMSGRGDFAELDKQAAANFAEAGAHLKHVIYLGGLQPPVDHAVSAHLRSRAETGAVLRARLPVTELRAGPIIGSGSASFEMLRYLVERLPVMVTPRWVNNLVQPIAIRDILQYLVAALDRAPMGIVAVGAEPLSFMQMMRQYAQVRGLHRLIFTVPVLTPTLSARWVGLITPIPNRLAVPLIQGVIEPLLCPDDRARQLFPEIQPMNYRTAVQRALMRTHEQAVETRWSGALGGGAQHVLRDWEGMIQEVRVVPVDAPAEDVFAVVTSLGGDTGWLVWRWAWWLRGLMDKVIGGPGLRRGRRHPTALLPGEAVDFWRVETVQQPALLRLRAEMKVPGQAWLQWQIEKTGPSQSRLVQTALFEPRGLWGVLYWYVLYPLHRVIFTSMARAIGRRAEQRSARGPTMHSQPASSSQA